MYIDWVFIIFNYLQLVDRKEVLFETVVPLLISALCATVYYLNNRIYQALSKLAEILPSIASILIGFTVMLITILLTSGSKSLDRLKEKESIKRINGKSVTLFQVLHTQFCHLLLIEVLLLFVILLYFFLLGIGFGIIVGVVLLFIEVFLTLTILLCIVRSVTNLHFAFFRSE